MRVFTEDWEMTLRAVTNVAKTAFGVAFLGTDYTMRFVEVAALEGKR